MKKSLAVLFCTLVVTLTGCVNTPFKIDPEATANVPWRGGEKIVEEGDCEGVKYYREFLGVTESGFALVQDFYLSGEKLSSPFLITVFDVQKNMEKGCPRGIEGDHTQWYKNGKKKKVVNFKNGEAEGLAMAWYESGQKKAEASFKNNKRDGLVTRWHKNGKKRSEGSYKNNERVGIWRRWNEKGNLTRTDVFGSPED